MPRPGRRCRCRRTLPGRITAFGGGDTMKASDIEAARPLAPAGAAARHPGTGQRPGRRRRPGWCAPAGACHGASAITAGLGRGARARTPVLLGVS